MLRIALDACGSEQAPHPEVDGALAALEAHGPGLHISLVGDRDGITSCLNGKRVPTDGIDIVHASQRVLQNEVPAAVYRAKPDSSMRRALELHASGSHQAAVSFGNTGAMMALSIRVLGRVPAVSRPGISVLVPTFRKTPVCILDCGANVDCRPEHLVVFAHMGSVACQYLYSVDRPRVALLNIGEEENKGSAAVAGAYPLLANGTLNFIGNIEGNAVLSGDADVIVCDGFTGNVLLKFGESIPRILREHLGAHARAPEFARIFRAFDYAGYGGAPLLGINGVSVVGHSGSSVRAVASALHVAQQIVKKDITRQIAEGLRRSAAVQIQKGLSV